MADIFKLIKGMSHTERTPRTTPRRDRDSLEKKERLDLDNFIVGEEEKRFQEKKKRTSIKNDFLDEEIGGEQDKKDSMRDINKLDFIELNKESEKKQNLVLKREYLTLLDKLDELSKEIDSLSKTSSTTMIELHQARKESYKLKELLRLIGNMLPEGSELKRTLDNTTWHIDDIEKPLIEKIQFVINRAKNADDYIEDQMKQVNQENKNLKRLILQMDNENTRLEQELEDAKNIKHESILSEEENDVHAEEPESEENPEDLREQEELEEMERMLAEKRKQIEEKNTANKPIEKNKPETQPQNQSTITPPTKPFYKFEEEAEEEDEDNFDNTHLLLDVEPHIDRLPEARKYLIEVIGKTGISRNQELRIYLEEDEKGQQFYSKGSKFNYQDMSGAVKALKDMGYLDSEKVNLGSKGGYNFQVFELTEIGKSIYKVLTKKNPAPPEKLTVLAQHKSLEHGYLIKDCATEFVDMGYTVLVDRADLRFDLPDGKRKDFDLIIEKSGEKMFLEVERGTHTDEDFFNAMSKIYLVMQQQNISPAQFHFVSPNEQVLFGKTKRQFFLWIKQHLGGIDEVKGKIVVNFTTFDKIKKRLPNMWESINL